MKQYLIILVGLTVIIATSIGIANLLVYINDIRAVFLTIFISIASYTIWIQTDNFDKVCQWMIDNKLV